MLSFVEYTSATAPAVRLRNAPRQYWDFVALTWVASENANTRVNYGESANGDGTSLYTVDITLPPDGPFIQQAVLPSGSSIAYGSTSEPELSAISSDTQAIRAKTDNLPASPAAVGSAMILTEAYDSAKTSAQPGDVAAAVTEVISALPAAPDNAGIAAIQAKTDNLPASPAATGDEMTLTSGTIASVIADTWSVGVSGSDPIMTRGEAVDHLYIPEYTGPTIVIPAPPTPDQQTLYGSNKEFGAAVFSGGDTITMTLVGNRNQKSAAGSILGPAIRTATVASDGTWSLTPDKGAYIKITAGNPARGIYFIKELTVSMADMKNIFEY